MNWAIIMAGGYGERFWPKSRRKQPKQLLPIVGDKTMIQQTVERVRPLVGDAGPQAASPGETRDW
jgi:mannose-1-phosphate guanylyltransferase